MYKIRNLSKNENNNNIIKAIDRILSTKIKEDFNNCNEIGLSLYK